MRPPVAEPRATEAVPQIIELVGKLLENGHAYQADGSVFFDVATFPAYGQLSHLTREDMLRIAAERGGRPDDPAKRNPLDFTLWQRSAPDEPAWDAPFGPGRPGLAHRVLGHGPRRPRPDPRPPRRRDRPDLPPPRERDRPERLDHRPAAGPPLDALGDGRLRRREDEQVAGEPGVRQRPPQGGRSPGDPAGPAPPPLPGRLRVVRHRPRRGQGAAPAPDGRRPTAAADPAFTGGADPRPFAEEVRAALDDDLDVPRALDALDDLASAILSGGDHRDAPGARWSSWPAWSAST